MRPFSFATLSGRSGKGAYPTRTFTDGVDAIVIRGTATELLPIQKIFKYSELLTLAMKQQTVNIKNQETQKIMMVNENTELEATETNKQFQTGASVIIKYKTEENNKLSEKYRNADKTNNEQKPAWEYNIPAVFISDKLQEQYEDWWASALTALGIPNVAVRKKERLNVAETLSNQDEVNLNSDMDYQLIKQGFDRVNELFGRNIQVTRNGMLMNNEILELGGNEEKEEVNTDESTSLE